MRFCAEEEEGGWEGGVGEGGGTEKKNTGVERAASGPDIPHLASTSGGKRSSGAFDTAITAENCGVRRFDGWMSRSCLTFYFLFFPPRAGETCSLTFFVQPRTDERRHNSPSDINWKYYGYFFSFPSPPPSLFVPFLLYCESDKLGTDKKR